MENQATATEEAPEEELPTEEAPEEELPTEEAAATPEPEEAAADDSTPIADEGADQEAAGDEPEPAVAEEPAEESAAEEQDAEEPAAEEEAPAEAPAAEEPAAGEPASEEPEAATHEEAAEEPEAAEDGEADEDEDEAAPVSVEPLSPYDLPGDWYVIHSYSGYENKVKANLETRVHSMHMESNIFDVIIPMEDVVEIKGGKKVTVPKKVFPGYILVRMYMDDDAWFTVRNTPGVTGFVGSPTKPTPLSRREVERILGVRKEEEAKAAPRFKPAWDVGEQVRVVDGPFADFNGIIEEINLDQSKVRVLVNIFGRETPVELNFEQIIKI